MINGLVILIRTVLNTTVNQIFASVEEKSVKLRLDDNFQFLPRVKCPCSVSTAVGADFIVRSDCLLFAFQNFLLSSTCSRLESIKSRLQLKREEMFNTRRYYKKTCTFSAYLSSSSLDADKKFLANLVLFMLQFHTITMFVSTFLKPI